MSDTRTFPDVDFVQKDALDILEENIASWEEAAGRKLSQADPVRVFLGWESAIDSQLYSAINTAAKLNVPRFAFGDYLDSLAEIFYFDLERIEASKATTQMKFELSTTSESATVVPVGTRCTSDGELMWETSETVYIPAGELSVTVTAICDTAGDIGNGFQIGEIEQCVDKDNVKNLAGVTNVTESEGGAARESDEDFYARMRESMSAYSAGTKYGYEYWAKTASALVTDAVVITPEPGKVQVFILTENGELPGEELRATVEEYIQDEKRRAFTDEVEVVAPTGYEYEIDLTWYLDKTEELSAKDAETAVQEAVDEFVLWQGGKIGRDLNQSELIRRVMETGIKRVEVRSPVFTTLSETEVGVCTGQNLIAGGSEDA